MPSPKGTALRAAALAAWLALSAPASPAPGSAESLLRLSEARVLLRSSPDEAIERLRPLLRRGDGDSLARDAAAAMLAAWEALGRPEGTREEAARWFGIAASSPLNGEEETRAAAGSAGRGLRASVPLRSGEVPRTRATARIVRAGDALWQEEGDSLLPLNSAAPRALRNDQVPVGVAGDRVLVRQKAQPQRLAWIGPEGEAGQIALPSAPAWVALSDDGRAAAAGEDWVRVWLGPESSVRAEKRTLSGCAPLRDPWRPWLLLLDCPGGERRTLDLGTAEERTRGKLPAAKFSTFTRHGEVRLTQSGLELRSSPAGELLWSRPLGDPRDAVVRRDEIHVREGEDSLLAFSVRDGSPLRARRGLDGEFFDAGEGFGLLAGNGEIRLLRRDGSVSLAYRPGQALAHPPVFDGGRLLLPLQDGSWIPVDASADEIAAPPAWIDFAKKWRNERDTSALAAVLEEEPGSPFAWNETAKNDLAAGRRDSAAAAMERSLRNRPFGPLPEADLAEWTSLWGARWAARTGAALPFRSPLLLSGGRALFIDDRSRALRSVDLRTRAPAASGIRSGALALAAQGPNRLFAAAEPNRVLRLDSALAPAAEAEVRGEILFAAPTDNGIAVLSQVAPDTSLVQWFDGDLAARGSRLLSDDLVPSHLLADGKQVYVGYPDGRVVLLAPEAARVFEFNQPLALMSQTDGAVLCALANAQIQPVSKKSWKLLPHLPSRDAPNNDPIHMVAGGGRLAVQRGSGELALLDEPSGAAAPEAKEIRVPGLKPSWAAPVWFGNRLLVPQPDRLLLVEEDGSSRKLAFLPSAPSSCALDGDELVCALEGGWIAGLPVQELVAAAERESAEGRN